MAWNAHVAAKNFYAELTDEAGNVISRVTAPVGEASAAGSIVLSPSLKKNLLYFRAYTSAMLNGDTNFIFVKPIRIITRSKTNKKKRPLSTGNHCIFCRKAAIWLQELHPCSHLKPRMQTDFR